MRDIRKSKELFQRAQQVIPGGVNSPVRAFKAVGGNPLFIESASGAYMFDADGNRYLDLINSWGPMILGHSHPDIETALAQAMSKSLSFGAPAQAEVNMAELITSMVPSIEKVRMVNSGTEATMSAIRLARGFTDRDKIIKFEGCYHGHGDSFLIAAGSGALTMGTPNSPGVTKGVAEDTLIATFNDLSSVEALVAANPHQIAALIIEPVAGNMGCVPPQPGFLEGLRTLCSKEGIVLIFDEVMTGFRLAPGGAQELYGVTADLTTLGKIIGGGLPVGAYGGRQDIMDYISPSGPVYQAGTLSGNPLAMTAGITMLQLLQATPNLYEDLANATEKLEQGLHQCFSQTSIPYSINRVGSMISLFFTDQQVIDFAGASSSDTTRFGTFFRNMLAQGVYLPPSQYESWFISACIDDSIVEQLIAACAESLKGLSS